MASIDTTYAKQFEEFHVGFEGSFGSKHVSPRTLSARFLGSLLCVEGIVTKCEKDLQIIIIFLQIIIAHKFLRLVISQLKIIQFCSEFQALIFRLIYLSLSC